MQGLGRAAAKGGLALVLVVGGFGVSAGSTSSAVPAAQRPAAAAVTQAAPLVLARTTPTPVHDVRRLVKPTRAVPVAVAVPFECSVHAAEAAAAAAAAKH